MVSFFFFIALLTLNTKVQFLIRRSHACATKSSGTHVMGIYLKREK